MVDSDAAFGLAVPKNNSTAQNIIAAKVVVTALPPTMTQCLLNGAAESGAPREIRLRACARQHPRRCRSG
jgi:hypothetical protein